MDGPCGFGLLGPTPTDAELLEEEMARLVSVTPDAEKDQLEIQARKNLGLPEPGVTRTCRLFWGSHGCDLPEGHPADQDHVCGSTDPDGRCSTHDGEYVRFYDPDTGELGEPMPMATFR